MGTNSILNKFNMNVPFDLFQTNKEERVPAKLPAQHWETVEFLCLLQSTSGYLPHWFLLDELGLKETRRS